MPKLRILTFVLLIIFSQFGGNFLYAQTKLKWYKGNTHTHTINSDGDSTPDEVVRWYRQHGYNFLVESPADDSTPRSAAR